MCSRSSASDLRSPSPWLIRRTEGVRIMMMIMNFISLAAFLALSAGSPTPTAKVESTCCSAAKAKATK
jgi:hypothetical protein